MRHTLMEYYPFGLTDLWQLLAASFVALIPRLILVNTDRRLAWVSLVQNLFDPKVIQHVNTIIHLQHVTD